MFIVKPVSTRIAEKVIDDPKVSYLGLLLMNFLISFKHILQKKMHQIWKVGHFELQKSSLLLVACGIMDSVCVIFFLLCLITDVLVAWHVFIRETTCENVCMSASRVRYKTGTKTYIQDWACPAKYCVLCVKFLEFSCSY